MSGFVGQPAPVMPAQQPLGGGQGASPLAQAMMGRMAAPQPQMQSPLSQIPLASMLTAMRAGQPAPGTVAGNAPVMGPGGMDPVKLAALQGNAQGMFPAPMAGNGGMGGIY